ncbi:MAG: pyrroline-5-carboxylate reductase [Bdellovibrionaceae bacterium]|nr:pyrroline-5-carboxylate reductase [Pseudobdellovibrionaceae bacterium]
MMKHYKVGFLGVGNMAQAIIKGLVESKVVAPDHIYAANRSPGKLQKATELWGLQPLATNEEVIDKCEIVVLAMKPQDLSSAIDPLVGLFNEGQIVISLAAGVQLRQLQRKLPQCRIARVMPNTPSVISQGVIGYLTGANSEALDTVVEDLFTPLGYTLKVQDEEQLEALTVSCSSGTGFVFEMMMYFQDWIEERGFDPATARQMVVQTFLGAAKLASLNAEQHLEDLQHKVTSKKGVTAAGLESMREFEIERALRYSFEKAALRNQELAKQG